MTTSVHVFPSSLFATSVKYIFAHERELIPWILSASEIRKSGHDSEMEFKHVRFLVLIFRFVYNLESEIAVICFPADVMLTSATLHKEGNICF